MTSNFLKSLPGQTYSKCIKGACVVLAISTLSACASTRSVPMVVQSDPQGAYVMYQLQSSEKEAPQADWIFLGNTPVDIRREIAQKYLKGTNSFVLRVMKDGFLDQQKAWTGEEMLDAAKEKGNVYWNPRLVKSN